MESKQVITVTGIATTMTKRIDTGKKVKIKDKDKLGVM